MALLWRAHTEHRLKRGVAWRNLSSPTLAWALNLAVQILSSIIFCSTV